LLRSAADQAMQRIPVDERANWRDRAEKMGFA
jgi:hypothetical protein